MKLISLSTLWYISTAFGQPAEQGSSVLPDIGKYKNNTSGAIEGFIDMSKAMSFSNNDRLRVADWFQVKLEDIVMLSTDDFKKSTQQGNCYCLVTSTSAAPNTPERNPGEKHVKLSTNDCTKLEKHMLGNSRFRVQIDPESCKSFEREIHLFSASEKSGATDYHVVAKDSHGRYWDKRGRAPVREVPPEYIKRGVIPYDRLIVLEKFPDSIQPEYHPMQFPEYTKCHTYCFDLRVSQNQDKSEHMLEEL